MRGRPGRGAIIGLVVGASLVGLLILLPGALRGDYYEVRDQLMVMGVPMVVLAAAVGALVGAPGRRVAAGAGGPSPSRPSRSRRVVTSTASVTVGLLALVLLLSGIGVMTLPPWGSG